MRRFKYEYVVEDTFNDDELIPETENESLISAPEDPALLDPWDFFETDD